MIAQTVAVDELRKIGGGWPAWQSVNIDQRLVFVISDLRLDCGPRGIQVPAFTCFKPLRLAHPHRLQAMKKAERYTATPEHLIKRGEDHVAHSSSHLPND